MGLLGFILGLPLAPVRGVIALTEVIRDRVDEEMRHPASARKELEAAEEAREVGEISEEEEAEVQQDVIDRMTAQKPTERKE